MGKEPSFKTLKCHLCRTEVFTITVPMNTAAMRGFAILVGTGLKLRHSPCAQWATVHGLKSSPLLIWNETNLWLLEPPWLRADSGATPMISPS